MIYTTGALGTVGDCDKVLLSAQKQKSSLEVRRTNLVYRQGQDATTSTKVEADLVMIEAKIGALTTLINALPDGDEKDDRILERMGYEYRQGLLERRSENYGIIGQLEKENELAMIDLQIGEMNAFIAAVEARKAELNV
ncbi:MAG: hypothetical protein ACKVOK_12220 [Flavobacteriales bacterium]